MSFTSSLPANLPKYGVPPTRRDGILTAWDLARGRERHVCTTYGLDHAVGVDRHLQILPNTDHVVGLETFIATLPQLDSATASEKLNREISIRDLSRLIETFFLHLSETDSGRGAEPGSVSLSPKYLDLQTGKIVTTPTPQSVYIGIGGISGCVVVAGVTLCYKKLGDILDWETLRDLLTAFKLIDDGVRELLDIIDKETDEES